MKILSAGIIFEPRDLWIGIYWTRKASWLWIYVCLVPCLPLRLVLKWR